MKQNKINFEDQGILYFGKKDSKGEFIEINLHSMNNADRLVCQMCKFCEERGIKKARFDAQVTNNGMAMVYCKEDVSDSETRVYLVAVMDSLLWGLIGWEDTEFTFENPDDLDDFVVSDDIIKWQRDWRKAFIELHTNGKGLSKAEKERLIKEHEND